MKIVQVIFLVVFLSACSQFQSGENSTTPTALIPSLVPTVTLTSSPTQTLVPVTLTVPPTNETCESPAHTLYSEISPDGNWAAVTCQQKTDNASSYLHVFNLHDQRDWRVISNDYAGNFYFDRKDVFYPFHWSEDGQSLYVVHPTRLSGTIGLGPGGEILLRIDLLTGQTQEVINGMGEFPQISFSFSHNDEYLLYIPQETNPYKVHILDLATQKTKVIELQGNNLYGVGFTLWSPDNERVLLLFQDEQLQYSMVLLDLADRSQITLVKDLEYPLYPIEWKDENIVLLSTNYPDANSGREQWLLDTRNGEMIKQGK